MDKLFDEILKAEEKANEIMASAKENCLKIQEETKIQKENIIKNLNQKARKKLENIKEIENVKYKEKLNEKEKAKNCEIERLNQIYEENKDMWVENILLKIIT